MAKGKSNSRVININYYTEPIDNCGRTESSFKSDIIFNVLHNVEDWNEDMRFEDKKGKSYSIEDLAGKKVLLEEIGIFTVPTE